MCTFAQNRYQKCVKLHIFYTKDGRKPLIMLGARQVGKTSVMKKFSVT